MVTTNCFSSQVGENSLLTVWKRKLENIPLIYRTLNQFQSSDAIRSRLTSFNNTNKNSLVLACFIVCTVYYCRFLCTSSYFFCICSGSTSFLQKYMMLASKLLSCMLAICWSQWSLMWSQSTFCKMLSA